jgi:type IX secretion system PorP/SprF family membrane protein
MKTRKVLIMCIAAAGLWLGTGTSYGQFDQMFTQYMHNEMFINPAYAGAKEAMAFTLLHRQQWMGFAGRPITTTFSVNAPFYQGKMGLGLSFLNEKIGVLHRNMIYASYAYRVKTGKTSYLSFGLMGGAHLQLDKITDLTTTDPDDPEFSTDLPLKATPNFGFGMYFNTNKFYASFSIPRMLDDHVKFTPEGVYEKGVSFNYKSLHYYLAVGRVFNINYNLKLKPHVMLKAALNSPMEFDVNLNALIKDKLWIGASYRSSADVSGIVGVQISPVFLVSYSYDYQLTDIHKFSSGSHEIVLSYIFDYKGKKIVSPRYF